VPQVTGLDHIVLNVSDARRSAEWYRSQLGLEPLRLEEFGRGEVFFPSVRVNDSTIIDLLEVERSGVNVDHLCLVLDGADLDAMATSGAFDVVDGPDVRWGARGNGRSLYVKDPDGNTVELRTYD
jgi:catechol 2,3-dioxygenase-like lactoylglutathione lyase family enzyme